jgi:hypothetical protein
MMGSMGNRGASNFTFGLAPGILEAKARDLVFTIVIAWMIAVGSSKI